MIGLLVVCSDVSWAQSPSEGWSPPTLLFDGPGEIHEPFVVGDQSGIVHILWGTEEKSTTGQSVDTQVIYYQRCCTGQPQDYVDVRVGASARSPVAAIDERGRVQMILFAQGRIQRQGSVVTEAQTARDWATAVPLDDALFHAHIVADEKGRLHVGYPKPGTQGPYYTTSADSGQHWSPQVNIGPTQGDDAAADWVRLTVTGDGAIHAVWTEFQLPNGWPPLGVFYARSTDEGQTWSTPTRLAGKGYTQANIVAADPYHLHVAWNGQAGIGGRYHRRSTDGGQTWSETLTVVPPGGAGTTGPPSLVVDSAGTLHLLTSDGPFYAAWDGQQWSKPARLPKPQGSDMNFVEDAVMTMTEGNKLHAVFWDDRKTLWYTTKQTNAPTRSPQPYPTILPTPTPAPTSTATPTRVPTPRPTETPRSETASTAALPLGSPAGQAVAFGMAPTLLLMAGVMAGVFWRSRQR